jgi:hypothetical protein
MDERERPSASLPTARRRGFLAGLGASALGTVAVSGRGTAETGDGSRRGVQTARDDGVRQQQRNGLSIGGESLGYALAGSTPSLNFSDSLEATIELWINHDGTSDEDAILLEKNEGGSNGYQISFDGGGEEPPLWFGWKFPNSNNWKVTSNSGIPANTWTHVACVYDGSQQAIYVDGELDATRTDWDDQQMNGNDAPFALGAVSKGNQRFFSGELDEIRLWSTARSLLQIRGSRLTTLSGDEDDLLAYYPFDGGTTADAARANDLERFGSVELTSPGGLPAPPKLYARGDDGEVSLRWSQRVGPTGQNEADTLRLYRSSTADGSDRTRIDEFSPDTTETTVSATNGEIAYYWLSAVDSEGHESDPSYPAIAEPSAEPFGDSLAFPGFDTRVTVDDRPRLDMPTPTETTIEFRVKHDGESDEDAILLGKNRSNANGYIVSFTGSTTAPNLDFGMKFPNGDNWSLVSTGGVPAGEWTHVACVYDGNKQVIYINGELDSTREDWDGQSMNGNGAPLRFGYSDGTGRRLFSGQLDDVRIWNKPRTRQEIQADYQRELYGDEEGLLAYWRTADDGTVHGSVGSGLTGDLEEIDQPF